MKTQHTATPWKVCHTTAPYLIVGNIKEKYSTWVVNDVASEANAAYIVKCVNSHEQLVEALKEASDALKDIISASDNKQPYLNSELQEFFLPIWNEIQKTLEGVSND